MKNEEKCHAEVHVSISETDRGAVNFIQQVSPSLTKHVNLNIKLLMEKLEQAIFAHSLVPFSFCNQNFFFGPTSGMQGLSFPPEIEPKPHTVECGVLTTGLPGQFHVSRLFKRIYRLKKRICVNANILMYR